MVLNMSMGMKSDWTSREIAVPLPSLMVMENPIGNLRLYNKSTIQYWHSVLHTRAVRSADKMVPWHTDQRFLHPTDFHPKKCRQQQMENPRNAVCNTNHNTSIDREYGMIFIVISTWTTAGVIAIFNIRTTWILFYGDWSDWFIDCISCMCPKCWIE